MSEYLETRWVWMDVRVPFLGRRHELLGPEGGGGRGEGERRGSTT